MKDYKLKLWKLRPWVARDTRFLHNCVIQGGKSHNISPSITLSPMFWAGVLPVIYSVTNLTYVDILSIRRSTFWSTVT